MALGPESPAECDCRTCGGVRVESSGRRANDTPIGVATTLKVGISHIGDRSIALDGSGDSTRLERLLESSDQEPSES